MPQKDIPTDIHNSYDEDLDLVRATLRSLLMSGEEGLQLAQEVARESEHPRAIEVLTGMIKQQSDNATALMTMHKKHKDINMSNTKEEQKQLTQNNVFVGSTTDIQKMLSNKATSVEVIDNNDD
jgi:hypothetical protein